MSLSPKNFAMSCFVIRSVVVEAVWGAILPNTSDLGPNIHNRAREQWLTPGTTGEQAQLIVMGLHIASTSGRALSVQAGATVARCVDPLTITMPYLKSLPRPNTHALHQWCTFGIGFNACAPCGCVWMGALVHHVVDIKKRSAALELGTIPQNVYWLWDWSSIVCLLSCGCNSGTTI